MWRNKCYSNKNIKSVILIRVLQKKHWGNGWPKFWSLTILAMLWEKNIKKKCQHTSRLVFINFFSSSAKSSCVFSGPLWKSDATSGSAMCGCLCRFCIPFKWSYIVLFAVFPQDTELSFLALLPEAFDWLEISKNQLLWDVHKQNVRFWFKPFFITSNKIFQTLYFLLYNLHFIFPQNIL